LDASLELTSVCIVDERGTVVCEAKVASEPEALIGFLRAQELLTLGYETCYSKAVKHKPSDKRD
jgi:hypothetical protein